MMTDFVEIPDDDDSENGVQAIPTPPAPNTNHAFDELRSLKSEMEFRGSLLGKTWSELSSIMTRYQAQIIQKHVELDQSLSGADHSRITQLENELKKTRTNCTRLQKQVTDFESKVLEKDAEIVNLRTEVHKLGNEVTMKDNLIQKLQAQMAEEVSEYQAEISSLKDVLAGGQEQEYHQVQAMSQPVVKRRKVVTKPQPMVRAPNSSPSPRKPAPSPLRGSPAVPVSQPIASSSSHSLSTPVKTESFQSSCQLSGPSTSNTGGSEMDSSSYQTTDQSFNESQDSQGEMDPAYFKVDEVYDDSNSGMELMQGGDPGMMLEGMQPGGQDQMLESGAQLSRNVSRGGLRLHTCLVCQKEFGSDNDLRRHYRVHSGVKPWLCLVCRGVFGMKGSAKIHVKRVHKLADDAENLVKYIEGLEPKKIC